MTPQQWSSRTVLVLGSEGMLGRELMRALREAGLPPEAVVGWDQGDLDICDRPRVLTEIGALAPSTVINAAAYTDVDGCESRRELAMDVNGAAPGHVAEACRLVGAVLVHIGTDYIFDGTKSSPYLPDDPPGPRSAYGESKWRGEQAVRVSGAAHLIVRTSWMFGVEGRHFVRAILERARSGEPLRVVDDQLGRPTLAADLAGAILRLLDRAARGTLHFANSGQCTWYEFARAILRCSGIDLDVHPITTRELNRPAERPRYSVLDLSRYEDLAGCRPRPWTEALQSCLDQLKARPQAVPLSRS